jgi:hypothetical protein
MKIEHGGSSVLLAGDTSFRPWKEIILPFYSDEKLMPTFCSARTTAHLAFSMIRPTKNSTTYPTSKRSILP